MTISVVIPTYNGEKYIRQAIESVLNQSRPADEIIISDDNSTDHTLEICTEYEDKIIIHTNAEGPSGFVNGWNNAIRHASCEYVSILHQDDILDSSFLEEIERAHSLFPDVKHFVTTCRYIDGDGRIIRKSRHCGTGVKRYNGREYADLYILSGGDHINRCPGVVTHKEIFNLCRYRPEAGHIADDDFFMRVGNFTDVVCLHKPLAFYREHTGSETGHLDYLDINLRLLKDHSFQISQFANNPVLSDQVKKHIRAEECKYIRRVFFKSIMSFKPVYAFSALEYFFKAVRRDKGKNIFLMFGHMG